MTSTITQLSDDISFLDLRKPAPVHVSPPTPRPLQLKYEKPQNGEQEAIERPPRVTLEDFEFLKVLGRGSYGKVFQVRKVKGLDSGRIFAMKSMRKDNFVENQLEMFHTRSERDVLATIDHPFLVDLLFAFETKNRVYLVQEFMRGGELFARLQDERFFMEDEARFYLSEITLALEYLHERDVIYRDLKSENIMFDVEGHIKLIDFGLCKQNISDDDTTYTFCGTVEYMAPEVIKRSGHGKPADWWNFGAFAFDILTGHSPFHHFSNNREQIKRKVLSGKVNYPKILTPYAIDLIRKLLRKEIDKRLGTLGVWEIKQHKFFRDIDWDKVYAKQYPPPFVPILAGEDDVSRFDERFTSISPRESECELNNNPNNTRALDNMFKNFEFVAPQYLNLAQ